MKYSVLPLLVAVLVAGCGSKSNQADSAGSSAAKRETVFDPLTGTLERARGVEDTVLDAAAERDRQID
jgi:hypothetical protein